MKKFTILISLMIILSSILFAQSNADIDPNAVRNPNATTFTDDLFDHQFDFPCGDASGEAGIETNWDYIYTSKWNGDGFFCYEMDGTFLGAFPVPGVSGVRDLAFDGNYFYGAAANTQLFEMEFIGQSGTLISTLTAAVATRACAYDYYYDAFWGNNWSDPITLYDRSGNILKQFDCGEHSSYYGFACVYPSCEGPYLYGFAQAGGASQTVIVQIDPETGDETGLTFDAIGFSTTGTGIAGGLAAFDTYAPGYWTLLGIIQNETIFGVEGGLAFLGPCVDLGLTNIVEPITGFGLGIENVIINVKNFGMLSQSNFEVRYRVNNSLWVSEMIPGLLPFGEAIEHTFTIPYDFSVIGEYLIEAEVILEGDENPNNDLKQKLVENQVPDYCEASTNTEDEFIAFVDFGLIQNASGWQGGVADYTNLINFLTSGSAEITVTNGNAWDSDKVTVWCDWNNDFIFDNENESNEKYVLTNDGTGSYFTGDITVQAGIGVYRMRIRMTYSSDPEPCDVSSYGEVEDYTIIIDCGCAEITWNPNSFSQSIEVGQTAQDFLNLGNTNHGYLIWEIDIDYPPADTAKSININTKVKPDASIIDKYPVANSDWNYDCPPGSVVSQECPDYSTAMTADEYPGYDFYQSFSGGGDIEGIRFWGIDAYFVGAAWFPCTGTEPKTFHIGFFADDGGQPGTMIDDFTIEVPRVATGDLFASAYNIYEYEIALPNSVTLNDGWFSVMAMTDPAPCWFLALNAPNGIGIGQQWDGSAWNLKDPMGFCLTGDAITPWLTLNTLEGIIGPYGSETLTLDFNAEGLEEGLYSANINISSNCMYNPEVIIPVTMIVGGPSEPHFIFEGGDPSSPIWTTYIGGATLEGSDLEAGDEIAIFDGDLLVGTFTLDQICTMENVFDNDLTAYSVLNTQAGFQAGNEFTFKCWDASEQEESDIFNYEFFNPYGDAYMGDVFPTGDGEYSVIDLDFYFSPNSHNLSSGYQIISSAVDPVDPDMTVVMADVLNDNLDFVRNSTGQMLRKIGPVWVNGIGDWIVEEGYLVKMFAPDSYNIIGAPINPATPIPIETGYQFVSYFPVAPMDALLAFETIIGDDLDFIRSSAGQTLRKIGSFWVNGIGDCTPTEGYLVKMFSDGEIIYPPYAKSCGKTIAVPKHFIFNGGNSADPVFTIYIDGLNFGDEIAAYDGDVLFGAMRINSQNAFDNELPVFSTLNNGKGYTPGKPIMLKVWNKTENKEYFLTDYTYSNPYGDAWTENVFPAEDGEYSLLHFSTSGISDENMRNDISIYPNPTTGIITIGNLNLTGLEITNITGKIVFQSDINNNKSSIEIDLSQLEKGVYFINFTGMNFNQFEKIVIQ